MLFDPNNFKYASRLPQDDERAIRKGKALLATHEGVWDPSLVSSRDHLKPLGPMPVSSDVQACAQIMALSIHCLEHQGRKRDVADLA